MCPVSLPSLPLGSTVQPCWLSWCRGWDTPALPLNSTSSMWSVGQYVGLFQILLTVIVGLFGFNFIYFYFSSCCCPITPAPTSTATLLWPRMEIQVKTVLFLQDLFYRIWLFYVFFLLLLDCRCCFVYAVDCCLDFIYLDIVGDSWLVTTLVQGWMFSEVLIWAPQSP